MILRSKHAEDREYRIHEVRALLTDAFSASSDAMTKAFMQAISSAFDQALPVTMLRWESSIAAKHRGEVAARRDSVLLPR
jgi:hypothetical protein